ncbi:MAG: hypothetical protein Kow00108_07900 [Calditrichia bacterium]
MESQLKNKIEALLFVADKPLKFKEIQSCLNEDSLTEAQLKELVESLNQEYLSAGKPFFIKTVANGYRYYIHDEYFPVIEPLVSESRKGKLTQKSLETLAIIAFKQPITKSEIEAIRGVNVDGVVRTLLERNLVKVAGRAQAPGNPLLYETTEQFLEYFGLNSLEDLPKLKEIDELLEADSTIKKEIGDVVLHEILPEKLGFNIEEAETKEVDSGANGDETVQENSQEGKEQTDNG